jgi:hypothetical protein
MNIDCIATFAPMVSAEREKMFGNRAKKIEIVPGFGKSNPQTQPN